MSREAKWIWKAETPWGVPAGARISAGKSGSVARSLPATAVSSVKRLPTTCIPSPESPAKRTTTRSFFSTVLSLIQGGGLSMSVATGPVVQSGRAAPGAALGYPFAPPQGGTRPSMKVSVPKETAQGERRVALVPEVVQRLVKDELEVVLEPGAGAEAHHPD